MIAVERVLAGSVAVVMLALVGCQQGAERQNRQDRHPETRETMPSSAFRNAYETLAASPSDAEISRLLSEAGLASLQGGIVPQDFELVKPLSDLVAHPRPAVRAAAAEMLGFLIVAHRREQHSSLSDAEKATVAPQVDAAIQALVSSFGDEDAAVRLAAVKAVDFVKEPALIGDLLPRLDDPDPLVRLQALMRLRRLRDVDQTGRIADAARELLDDPDPQVRELAGLIAARSPD